MASQDPAEGAAAEGDEPNKRKLRSFFLRMLGFSKRADAEDEAAPEDTAPVTEAPQTEATRAEAPAAPEPTPELAPAPPPPLPRADTEILQLDIPPPGPAIEEPDPEADAPEQAAPEPAAPEPAAPEPAAPLPRAETERLVLEMPPPEGAAPFGPLSALTAAPASEPPRRPAEALREVRDEPAETDEAPASAAAAAEVEASEVAAEEVEHVDILAKLEDLPRVYRSHTVRLALVDPERSLLFWDLDPARVPAGRPLAFQLRRQTALGPTTLQTVPLGRMLSGDYYVTTQPGSDYDVVLGTLRGGRFEPLLSSNILQTPALRPRFASFARWKVRRPQPAAAHAGQPESAEWSEPLVTMPPEPAPLMEDARPLNFEPVVEMRIPQLPPATAAEAPVFHEPAITYIDAPAPERPAPGRPAPRLAEPLLRAQDEAFAAPALAAEAPAPWAGAPWLEPEAAEAAPLPGDRRRVSAAEVTRWLADEPVADEHWSGLRFIDEGDVVWRLEAAEDGDWEVVSEGWSIMEWEDEALLLPSVRWLGASEFTLSPVRRGRLGGSERRLRPGGSEARLRPRRLAGSPAWRRAPGSPGLRRVAASWGAALGGSGS